ncbi:MAG: hypothetical protein ACP5F3_03170 [Candidatus Syntrophosphaera sp.]
MFKKQKGSTLFWVISVILAIVVIFLLALSGRYNLDPEKNIDDCTTNMKNIWVAANDYVLDTQADFEGDLDILRNTRMQDRDSYYLEEEKYCPESQGEKIPYHVFGKHATEVINAETRHYAGIIVLCPNLDRFGRHLLDKTFYDNMSTSKLQNIMINDMARIDDNTKSNTKLKAEYMHKYMDYWKNTPITEFQKFLEDPAYQKMRQEVTGESPQEEEPDFYF